MQFIGVRANGGRSIAVRRAGVPGRVVVGGVSPVPYRAAVVEAALKGKDVKSNAKAAAAQIRTVARPMSLNAYKVDLVQGIIERTLLQALG